MTTNCFLSILYRVINCIAPGVASLNVRNSYTIYTPVILMDYDGDFHFTPLVIK